MKAPEVISILEKHLECIRRQHTPQCNRECQKCDTCATKSGTVEALETALKVLKYIEQKRSDNEQRNSTAES